jgi:hypothetical protein
MSKALEEHWQPERAGDAVEPSVLVPRLRALVEAPFVRTAGALLLRPLAGQSTDPSAFPDRTGYEAFINKIHVEDFLDREVAADDPSGLAELVAQGIAAAMALSERLEKEGAYRVLLSLDSDVPALTLRFFERREGEPWGPENPEDAPLEEVLLIDTR